MTFKVSLLTGPPGCGKSHTMLATAIAQPGRYVFCSPTTALIEEQFSTVAAAGVRAFRCDSASNLRGTVARKLSDTMLRVKREGLTHVVIFITHIAMFAARAATFQGWHVMIDEAPDGLKTGRLALRTEHSRAAFAELFDLERIGAWAHAKPKLKAPQWRAVSQDTLLSAQAEFFRLAERPYGLFVRTENWSEEEVDWFSLWSPLSFDTAASVQIAAASFETSLAYKAAKNWFGLEVISQSIHRPQGRSAATVTVYYFTEGHEGTSAFWATSRGRRMIKGVCDYLGSLPTPLGFWSGNAEVQALMEWRVGAKDSLTKPKLAGRNGYDQRTSCAFIYSSKALPGDTVLGELFDLTADDILAAREDEDIHQFIMRGALRDPTFTGTYDVYLYSKRQADTLARTLTTKGFAVQVSGVPEAGIMQEGRSPATTRRSAGKKAEQRVPNARGTGDRSRKSAQRQKQRQAKKAIGSGPINP